MLLLIFLIGYCIGGIPFAVPVVRLLHGVDVRTTGSGNVGARNSLRVGGPLAGGLVLALDALKAALPMLAVRSLTRDPWQEMLIGVAVVFGHCFSPYLIARAARSPWPGWRGALLAAGGQGLASALGVMFVVAPLIALPVVLLGALLIFGFKRSTGAALAAILTGAPAAAAVGYPATAIAALGLCGVIIFIKLLQDLIPAQTN